PGHRTRAVPRARAGRGQPCGTDVRPGHKRRSLSPQSARVCGTMTAFPRVLLVDDEPDLLDLMELTLIKMGLETDRATSVAEAQVRLLQTQYDLCLTDMRLGDGEGLEVIAAASTLTSPVPVAVITAYGNAGNA